MIRLVCSVLSVGEAVHSVQVKIINLIELAQSLQRVVVLEKKEGSDFW
jgi:hypothetical protein